MKATVWYHTTPYHLRPGSSRLLPSAEVKLLSAAPAPLPIQLILTHLCPSTGWVQRLERREGRGGSDISEHGKFLQESEKRCEYTAFNTNSDVKLINNMPLLLGFRCFTQK